MGSRFTHHFGTNYVPTDEEIEEIRADLFSRTEELARVDEQIRELYERRDQLQAYIEPRKALISHPRRLPIDILGVIFLECLPTTRNAVMSAQEAPLLLCRICSAWRTTALSMPRLWASLHIPFNFILKNKLRISAVDQWLARAAASSMSVSFRGAEVVWGAPDSEPTVIYLDDNGQLAKTIARYSAGWQNVELTWMSDRTAEALAGIHAPRLESFKLTGYTHHISHFDQLLRGSRLQTVALYLDSNLMHALTLPIAWHQLTTLIIHFAQEPYPSSISLGDMIYLLEWCPRLVLFHVIPMLNEIPFEYGSLSVHLPSLESFFTVPLHQVLPNWYLACIIDCVSMPKLRHFHFPINSGGSGQDSLSIASIGAKYPLVEDFAIYINSLNAQALLEALRAFPALTKLAVNAHMPLDDYRTDLGALFWEWDNGTDSCGAAQLLEVLSDTTVCSRLQELEVIRTKTLSRLALLTFLSARMQMESMCRLCRLSISFQTSWGKPVIPPLSPVETKYYASLGLRISFFPQARAGAPDTSSPWTGLLSP
ncbi:hypothetical protein R3P38DRAFT_3068830 [Favolaschia claudopus]|uniref:F-box domain-containing protein n=1 Tax=Favolaschia claudopus TaxID=2862362 RepID=A0AAW0A0E1_9AGAR